MQRVVILGCSGAGKSTFARALGERLGLPVTHLDALFWRPGWKEPEAEAFRTAVASAVAGDAWVTDGNFVSRTFELRLPRADAVIFIHQPRWLCVFRILWRWMSSFGRRRPDLAEGCQETFDWTFFLWTWNFERQSQPRILEMAALSHPDHPPARRCGDGPLPGRSGAWRCNERWRWRFRTVGGPAAAD